MQEEMQKKVALLRSRGLSTYEFDRAYERLLRDTPLPEEGSRYMTRRRMGSKISPSAEPEKKRRKIEEEVEIVGNNDDDDDFIDIRKEEELSISETISFSFSSEEEEEGIKKVKFLLKKKKKELPPVVVVEEPLFVIAPTKNGGIDPVLKFTPDWHVVKHFPLTTENVLVSNRGTF